MVFRGSEEMVNENLNNGSLMFSQTEVANQVAIAVLQNSYASQQTTNSAQQTVNVRIMRKNSKCVNSSKHCKRLLYIIHRKAD